MGQMLSDMYNIPDLDRKDFVVSIRNDKVYQVIERHTLGRNFATSKTYTATADGKYRFEHGDWEAIFGECKVDDRQIGPDGLPPYVRDIFASPPGLLNLLSSNKLSVVKY